MTLNGIFGRSVEVSDPLPTTEAGGHSGIEAVSSAVVHVWVIAPSDANRPGGSVIAMLLTELVLLVP